MNRPASAFSPVLTTTYWLDVEELLRTQYQFDPQRAKDGVLAYLNALAAVGVGDIVYHEDVRETARAIRNGGFAP